MNLKTRLLAGASALAFVGGIAAIGASPASAGPPPSPTTLGVCTNNWSIAQIKNPVTFTGLTNTLASVKIGVKATGAPTCNGVFLQPGAAIDAASFKASIVGEASCNTSLTPPAPPTGKFGFTQSTLKEQGFLRFASVDPTGSFFYSDVVSVHGMLIKGLMAGVDMDGSLFQNPTYKDKTLPQDPRFPGYDVNAFDSLTIGASCLSGSSSGNLLFNDFSGATCVGTKCKPIPTDIKLTLVGDGTSLLEAAQPIALQGAGGGNNPAEGLTFSIY